MLFSDPPIPSLFSNVIYKCYLIACKINRLLTENEKIIIKNTLKSFCGSNSFNTRCTFLPFLLDLHLLLKKLLTDLPKKKAIKVVELCHLSSGVLRSWTGNHIWWLGFGFIKLIWQKLVKLRHILKKLTVFYVDELENQAYTK